MVRTIVYSGTKFTIAFAREKSGACPAAEFFAALSVSDQAKLMALFRIAADHGAFHNPEKFGDLGGGLFEFKSFQVRMPFAYSKKHRGMILVTHGFIKKKNKTPKEEIARAWRIWNEDQAQGKLAVMKKANR
jgi:phage-related protein